MVMLTKVFIFGALKRQKGVKKIFVAVGVIYVNELCRSVKILVCDSFHLPPSSFCKIDVSYFGKKL